MNHRYQRIEHLAGSYPVSVLCKTMGISRSGYYAWLKREPSSRQQEDTQLIELLRQEHQRSRQTYGRPRLCEALRQRGQRHSSKRIARLMKANGLVGRPRRRFHPQTTDSRHNGPIAPNRLADTPTPGCVDEIWVTDLTYVATQEGWLYVSAIMDLYSRRIVGWSFGASLAAELPMRALQMALRHRQPTGGTIHHSDRGSQYASAPYRQLLLANGLQPSMSRAANCYDNATMESFWSTLKQELIYRCRFVSRAQAQAAIFDYIETFYNPKRLHSALGYKSPVDFEHQNN